MADQSYNRDIETTKQRDERLHTQRIELEKLQHDLQVQRDKLRHADELERARTTHAHTLAQNAAYAERDKDQIHLVFQHLKPILDQVGGGIVTMQKLALEAQRDQLEHERLLAKESPDYAEAKLEHQATMAKAGLEHSAKMSEVALQVFSSPALEKLCTLVGLAIAKAMTNNVAVQVATTTPRTTKAVEVEEDDEEETDDLEGEDDETAPAEAAPPKPTVVTTTPPSPNGKPKSTSKSLA